MKVIIRKLFAGKVSLRDYEVEKAQENKEDVEILFNDQRMTISWNLLNKGVAGTTEFQSKWDNKKYKLIDFVWNPTNNSQTKLL